MTEADAWAWVAGNGRLARWAACRYGVPMRDADYPDAVQVATVAMYQAMRGYDPKKGKRSVLAVINARRRLNDWRDRRSRHGFRRTSWSAAVVVRRPASLGRRPKWHPAGREGACPVETAEAAATLRAAIAGLPPALRLAAEARLAGLTAAAAGALAGIARSAAKDRWARARVRLLATLGGQDS